MAERHTLVMQVYEDVREPKTLDIIHVVDAGPQGNEYSLRPIVFDVLTAHEYLDGYTLEKTDGAFEWGASSVWEEIVLGLSTAMGAGTVEAIVSSLIARFIDRRAIAHPYGRGTLPDAADFDVLLSYQKDLVAKHYKLPKRLLKLVNSDYSGSVSVSVFEDDVGKQYRVEAHDNGYHNLRIIK